MESENSSSLSLSPKRLARNRTRMNADSAELARLVNDANALSVLGTFNGAFLARGIHRKGENDKKNRWLG